MSTGGADWRPDATIERLRLRARLAAEARAFFAARGVLEVETPCLSAATTSEPQLDGMVVGRGAARRWLVTSPEFAMKRLLAAGSGPIFQFARVFRAGERGRLHNPEFTLLEWYRPGLDHLALIAEVAALVEALTGCAPCRTLDWHAAFRQHVGFDPEGLDARALAERAVAQDPAYATLRGLDVAGWLDLLASHHLVPRLGDDAPAFLVGFPVAQAGFAPIDPGPPPRALRFELYWRGIELANGYRELTCPLEWARRVEADLARRRRLRRACVVADRRVEAALAAGVPEGSGVALGFDRLVLCAAGAQCIDEVLAFAAERA